MDTLHPESAQPSSQTVTVAQSDRWHIQHRLQELDIACACAGHSLQVEANSFAAMLQLWSIIFQLTASRSQQLDWLERCWSVKHR